MPIDVTWSRQARRLTRYAAPVLAGLSALAVMAFVSHDDSRAQADATRLLVRAPLSVLAPVFGISPLSLQAIVARLGYPSTGAEDTLENVAFRAKLPPERLLAEVIRAHAERQRQEQDPWDM